MAVANEQNALSNPCVDISPSYCPVKLSFSKHLILDRPLEQYYTMLQPSPSDGQVPENGPPPEAPTTSATSHDTCPFRNDPASVEVSSSNADLAQPVLESQESVSHVEPSGADATVGHQVAFPSDEQFTSLPAGPILESL